VDEGSVAPFNCTIQHCAIPLRQGAILHDADAPIEHVYFPQSGMVSVVGTMRDGTMVETVTLGRASVICANAALGSRHAVGTAIVQIPGEASQLRLRYFGKPRRKVQRSASAR
jgi:hypothetical protein